MAPRLRHLFRRRRGASYALPLVLVVPFYLMFVLTVCELAILLLAKVGTQYAAYAAARSAAVWASADPKDVGEQRVRQAAWAALAPFISGRQYELDTAGPVPAGAQAAARSSAAATARYLNDTNPGEAPPADFLERKHLVAAARTTVTVERQNPDAPHGPVRVTVTFRAPLHMPVVSRFLDADGAAPFEYPLTATATLPTEAPETESQKVGIPYTSTRPAQGDAR